MNANDWVVMPANAGIQVIAHSGFYWKHIIHRVGITYTHLRSG